MFELYANGEPQRIVLDTGIRFVSLEVVLTNERIDDPYLLQKPYRPGDVFDLEAVKSAIFSGIDEANTQFGTCLYPLSIKFQIEGWLPDLLQVAAFRIIERIAKAGKNSD